MPVATETRTFNYELFKKRIRLFDSDSDGERNLAISQALRQCAEHRPPLLFWEAARDAFGGGNGDNRCAGDGELYEEVVRLREEVAQAARVNDDLIEETREMSEEIHRLSQASMADAWLDPVFERPRIVLGVLGAINAGEWLVDTFWQPPRDHTDCVLVVQLIHSVCMVLFLLWSIGVFKTSGLKRLLIGWGVWATGWAALDTWRLWYYGGFAEHPLEVKMAFFPNYWWSNITITAVGVDLWVVLFTLGLVIDLNMGMPVTGWVVAKLKTLMER